jgi:hypothetical protein
MANRTHTAEAPPTGDVIEDGPLSLLRLFYVTFTQTLFHYHAPRNYRWEPEPERTRIVITTENTLRAEALQQRPAISFTRGPVQSFSLGFGDVDGYDMATGQKTKSILLPGTMSINCCSRNSVEAENIASYIATSLWAHSYAMMQAGFYDGGRSFVIGAASSPGSLMEGDLGEEWYVVTVSSPFQLKHNVTLTPLNVQMLQSITSNMRTLSPTPFDRGPSGVVGGNLPFGVKDTVPGLETYKRPHPLDPTREVTVKAYKPYRSR